MKKFFQYGHKGFTLIELLVVIAILGTLAAVVILNVTKYIGSGKTEAAKTELANVQTAVAAWMYDQSSAGASTDATEIIAAGTKGTKFAAFFLNSVHGNYTVSSVGQVTAGVYP